MTLRGWDDSEERRTQESARIIGTTQSGNAALKIELEDDTDFMLKSGSGSSTYDLYKDLGGKPTKLGGTFGRKPSEDEDSYHEQLARHLAEKRSQTENKLSLLEKVRLYFLGY